MRRGGRGIDTVAALGAGLLLVEAAGVLFGAAWLSQFGVPALPVAAIVAAIDALVAAMLIEGLVQKRTEAWLVGLVIASLVLGVVLPVLIAAAGAWLFRQYRAE